MEDTKRSFSLLTARAVHENEANDRLDKLCLMKSIEEHKGM